MAAGLIRFGWFASHSKFQLPWKIDADALSDDDVSALADIIRCKFSFGHVEGIPKGGLRLAKALLPHATPGHPLLIVDDVLTTGASMERAREQTAGVVGHTIGVVIFARGRCPDWIWPIFSVNEWAQSRATGLG